MYIYMTTRQRLPDHPPPRPDLGTYEEYNSGCTTHALPLVYIARSLHRTCVTGKSSLTPRSRGYISFKWGWIPILS